MPVRRAYGRGRVMADSRPRFNLSPEDTYELMVAALDLVSGVSANVHKRIRQPGSTSNNPGVRAVDLIKLVDVLNSIRSNGGFADRVIGK